MKTSMKTLLCLLLVMPLAGYTQDAASPASASCSEAGYRAFDFWLGDWDVTSNGQPAGSNSITRILDGCALQEEWQGAGAAGVRGKSFNVYDKANGSWHQTWVDSTGTLLVLDGGLVDGAMVLSGERPAPDGKGTALHRIAWTANEDGSVRQLWEVSRDDGENWSVLFDGHYVRSDSEG